MYDSIRHDVADSSHTLSMPSCFSGDSVQGFIQVPDQLYGSSDMNC